MVDPAGPQRRRDLPAQQLQQAQHRHRPEVARGPRAVPRARAALRRDRRELQAGHDGSHGPRLRRDRRARIRGAIYVSISGFGNTVETPYRDWPAYASIVEAMSGIYDYRHPDEPPVTIPVGALGDISSALFGVIGILAALRHRERTGAGPVRRHRDVRRDGVDDRHRHQLLVNGCAARARQGAQVICEGFRASDGYVVVQIVREHQFFNLADLVGHPEWKDDPRFATRAGWGPHLESVIRPAVDAWASTAHEARRRAASSPRRASSPARATTPPT